MNPVAHRAMGEASQGTPPRRRTLMNGPSFGLPVLRQDVKHERSAGGHAGGGGRFEYYAHRHGHPGFASSARSVTAPAWFFASVLGWPAVLVAFRIRRAVIRRGRRDGRHCAGCGYDLRATPERCPECGMIPAT